MKENPDGERHFRDQLNAIKRQIDEQYKSRSALLSYAAECRLFALIAIDGNNALNEKLDAILKIIESKNPTESTKAQIAKRRADGALANRAFRDAMALFPNAVRSDGARKAARALQDNPNGPQKKRIKIQDLWSTGKYRSRKECARKECKALHIEEKTARKYLYGTPDPYPWPAKNK